MDADFSHDPDDLIRLYKACHEEKGDVAIGSRYIKGVNIVNWPMSRLLMSFFASKYVKIITGMPIQDSTAGFKCYRRSVLEKINLLCSCNEHKSHKNKMVFLQKLGRAVTVSNLME